MNITHNRDKETAKNGKLKKNTENLAVTVYLSYFAELFCNKKESESGKRKQNVLNFASGADMGILKANNF